MRVFQLTPENGRGMALVAASDYNAAVREYSIAGKSSVSFDRDASYILTGLEYYGKKNTVLCDEIVLD